MNYISPPTKSTKRFNFLDLIIIVAVLVAIAGVFFRFFIEKNNSPEGRDTVSVIFTAEGLTKEEIASIEENALVYIERNGERIYLGSVADNNIENVTDIFKTEIMTKTVLDENGNYVSAEYPEGTQYRIFGKIKANGIYSSEHGFSLKEGISITPGLTLLIHTEKADVSILITGIVK